MDSGPQSEKKRLGFISTRFAGTDGVSMEARKWAALLARKSPIATQISKKAFYAAADLDYYKAFEYMNEAFARLCTTEDAKEGVAAFFEKRNPEWKLR